MTRGKFFGSVFATVTIAALFMFLPMTSDQDSEAAFIGVKDACAQTGTCAPDLGSICFVNGVGYDNREWRGGGTCQTVEGEPCEPQADTKN